MFSQLISNATLIKYAILLLCLSKLLEETHRRSGKSQITASVDTIQTAGRSTQRESFLAWLVKPPVIVPSSNTPSHHLSIVFCKSCHANGLYRQIEQLIQQRVRWMRRTRRSQFKTSHDEGVVPYTSDNEEDEDSVMIPISVEPIAGRVAPLFVLLGMLVGVVQIVVVALCIVGVAKSISLLSTLISLDCIKRLAHNRSLQIYDEWFQGNRWRIIAILFLVGNMLRNTLTTTKAFELYLGNKIIYSKLASGMNPTLPVILEALEAAGAIILP